MVFIRGKKAILTIYDVPDDDNSDDGSSERVGWVEKEKIALSDHKARVSITIASYSLCVLTDISKTAFSPTSNFF